MSLTSPEMDGQRFKETDQIYLLVHQINDQDIITIFADPKLGLGAAFRSFISAGIDPSDEKD